MLDEDRNFIAVVQQPEYNCDTVRNFKQMAHSETLCNCGRFEFPADLSLLF